MLPSAAANDTAKSSTVVPPLCPQGVFTVEGDCEWKQVYGESKDHQRQRIQPEGTPFEDFPKNRPESRDDSILITGIFPVPEGGEEQHTAPEDCIQKSHFLESQLLVDQGSKSQADEKSEDQSCSIECAGTNSIR